MLSHSVKRFTFQAGEGCLVIVRNCNHTQTEQGQNHRYHIKKFMVKLQSYSMFHRQSSSVRLVQSLERHHCLRYAAIMSRGLNDQGRTWLGRKV